MRILHVLDHSIPLHSGYMFRTRAILEQQRDFLAAADTYRRLAALNARNAAAFSTHMLSAARAYKSHPDWQQARDAAGEVIDRYPDAYLAADARVEIVLPDQLCADRFAVHIYL